MPPSKTNGHHARPSETATPELVLITGFPSVTARRLAAEIVAQDTAARVRLLVRETDARAGRQFLATLPAGQADRADLLVGDVRHMDLGLSGEEYRGLLGELTAIHHLAGSCASEEAERDDLRRFLVSGTRNVLELASEAQRLRRMCHWSTAAVSGKRKGVVLEEELDEGQGFHNQYEELQFEAERLARQAQHTLPLTVFRPGIIVGDSKTGEIDRFDGPYYLILLIAGNALNVHLPLPGRGTAPMHLVPIDYVIAAAHALSRDERAAGRTFHLTDSNPLPARRIYELVATYSHKKSPRGFIPAGLTRTLLKTPGLDRLARAPLAFLDSFDHQVFYNSRHTLALLEGSGISCPAVDTYLENLVSYVRRVRDARRQRTQEDEVFDPLD
jgi:thioester reductase-like protein